MAASRELHPLFPQSADPLVLLVPGADDAASAAWLAYWRGLSADCQPVDLGMWHDPHRNTPNRNIGVNKLNLAIHRAERPVVLVAHGLGCMAVAWWVEYETPPPCGPVVGALFESPPDIDRPGADPRLARFNACPRQPLPFPAWIIADPQRPEAERATLRHLAQDWGSGFVEAENEPAGPGAHGVPQRLLGRLLHGAGGGIAPPASGLVPSSTLRQPG